MSLHGAGAHILRLQHSYMEQFNKLGAVDKEHAVSLDQIDLKNMYVFHQMVKHGVFIKCKNGKYYVNNHKGLQYKSRKPGVSLIVMVLILAIIYLLGEVFG